MINDTTVCDKVCQWLTAGRWFSLGTPVSSTNKADRHTITKILLKMTLNSIIIYLETKFRSNRRIFVFWRSFWIQNGGHSKPKWSQYGAACFTPCIYPFPLKSFHFWIFNDFFLFLYWRPFWNGGHFENYKNKEHNFEW